MRALKEAELDEGMVFCPKCEGARQQERIKGYPNRDGGNTEWVDCDLCSDEGQVEDDRETCACCEVRGLDLDENEWCPECAASMKEEAAEAAARVVESLRGKSALELRRVRK